MKTTIELAAELEAERKLRNAGYSKQACTNPRCLQAGKACHVCGGNGYFWESADMLLARLNHTVKRAKVECGRWDKALERWEKSGVFKAKSI